MWSKGNENMVKVLYEDNQVIVVIKPQNMPSQEDGSKDEDLLNEVKAYVKEKYNKQGEAYIGLVHRLDRPTGGIMVFARTSKAASRLSEQIREGKMNKVYFAICEGLPQPQGHLVNYLKKDEKENKVKIVPQTEQDAKRAELYYKVLERNDKHSLLEVKIITGRSHQIRVQLSAIGCPLVGDNKYGKKTRARTSLLGLWAGRLEFFHPVTKDKMIFVCPPESDKAPWKEFYLDKYFIR